MGGVLEKLTRELAAARNLTEDQIQAAVDQLVAEAVPAAVKAEFLGQLAIKGETPAEIAAFAGALRDKCIRPPVDRETRERVILDVVGTGGDHMNTFNISTAVAILCAAGGVVVAKHGNRAVTSKVGSADVLEALGVRIDLPPDVAAQSLREHGFAFFFAPHYHPSFKHIAPARKLCAERGQRTIFNFLGPLLNPVRPSAQLMGVPRPEWCESLGRVLRALGVRRGMVVCGKVPGMARSTAGSQSSDGYLDELSIFGENAVAEFNADEDVACRILGLEAFRLQPATLAALAGNDRETNAEFVRVVLGGQERGPKRDAVLLNAAAALSVAGRVPSLIEGWTVAADLIDSGKALKKLQDLVKG